MDTRRYGLARGDKFICYFSDFEDIIDDVLPSCRYLVENGVAR